MDVMRGELKKYSLACEVFPPAPFWLLLSKLGPVTPVLTHFCTVLKMHGIHNSSTTHWTGRLKKVIDCKGFNKQPTPRAETETHLVFFSFPSSFVSARKKSAGRQEGLSVRNGGREAYREIA